MIQSQVDIIHGADEVVLSAYTYSAIYAESLSTVVINGVTINVPTGVVIPINIRSISSVSTVYCLGTASNSLYAPSVING